MLLRGVFFEVYSFQTNHGDKILLFIVTLTPGRALTTDYQSCQLKQVEVTSQQFIPGIPGAGGIYHLQVKTGNSGFPVWFPAIRLGGFRKYGL